MRPAGRRLVLLLALAAAPACSGKARHDGPGSSGAAGGSGGSGGSAAAGSSAAGTPDAAAAIGDAQIRVEWADVPSAARASPGRTPCNTPRAPSVAPTATWGIPDAVVIVEDARADAAEARIVLADCALSPRVAIGTSLVVESAVDRPASVALAKRAELAKPEAAADGGAPRVLRLPIAGHAVAVALDAGGLYELATADKAPETAWIAAPPQAGAAVAVTDATGQVVLRGLPAGPHAVTAWLPPRAGQPARLARGTVTVAAGALAELTLRLEPVP